VQEGFLVLSGECTLLVEEEARPLRQWDYSHSPAETRHVIVGAGDGPCAILMLGARPEVEMLRYPVSEIAAKYGASVAKETDKPDEAYADWPASFSRYACPGRPVPDRCSVSPSGYLECFGGYCVGGANRIRVYSDGKLVTGDPRALPLEEHEEIVVTYATKAEFPSRSRRAIRSRRGSSAPGKRRSGRRGRSAFRRTGSLRCSG
jgi:hypothetical protein